MAAFCHLQQPVASHFIPPADVDRWLEATSEEALALQKPAPDEALVMLPPEAKAA